MSRPSRIDPFLSSAILLLASGASAAFPGVSRAAVSPEEETLKISAYLKPVSNEEWTTVAGERISEDYEVVRGDTLYDISQRLFGDARYWPKIWALNNGKITNPHVIIPGQKVAFLPGSGSSLPGLSLGGDQPEMGSPGTIVPAANQQPPGTKVASNGKSSEWKDLPRQPWEHVPVALPAEVDPNGFDRRSRVTKHKSTGLDLSVFAASEKLPYIGEITGSRSAANYLTLGDVVYIKPTDAMQVGEIYTITRDPYLLKSRKSDRLGYSYLILGEVKIIGVRDGLFIATIIGGREFTARGSYVMPRVPRVKYVKPIPADRSLEGVLILDRNISTYTTAQHKLVFVDRGSNDGVKPGMVFRAYQHRDPSNDTEITRSDFIIDGDFMVLQASPAFCVAIAIRSLVPIFENTTVILLTDVSDLEQKEGIQSRSLEQKGLDDELDQLDRLDPSSELGDKERRELRQLEQWEGNPPEDELPPPPDTTVDPFAPPGEIPRPENSQTDDQLLTPSTDPVPDAETSEPIDFNSLESETSGLDGAPEAALPSGDTPPAEDPFPDSEPGPDGENPFPDSEIPTDFEGEGF